MDIFSPPVDNWQTLDPRYLTMKRLMVLVVWSVELVAAVLAVGFGYRWWAAGVLAVLGLATMAYRWWRQVRVFRNWGYAERETELYIRRGLMFRSLTVVPYGRMQVVEVEAGPVQRRFGLATVELKTSSPHTNASIPGLSQAQADALRERLTELGEQQAVGL